MALVTQHVHVTDSARANAVMFDASSSCEAFESVSLNDGDICLSFMGCETTPPDVFDRIAAAFADAGRMCRDRLARTHQRELEQHDSDGDVRESLAEHAAE